MRRRPGPELACTGVENTVNVSEERTVSVWMDVEVRPDALPLMEDTQADTVVIGGGIAGLSSAYELAQRGHSVIVLDRGRIGMGQTARTTAHLACDSDDSFEALISTRGLDAAKLFYASHAAAIDRIETIQAAEKIDCHFRRLDGILFPALGQDASTLDAELGAARKIGIAVEAGRGLPFAGLQQTPYLAYARQAAFHPLRYLRGLAAAIVAKGGRLHANTGAEAIEEKDGSVIVTTENGPKVRARYAVFATNSPTNDWVAIHSKQAPYRSYAMAFTIARGALPDALYWDTLDPYHYVRLATGPGETDHLIVGGADHKTGEADDASVRFDALTAWIRSLVPELGDETHRWSGQVYEPIDYCGFIGRNPGNQSAFIATGDSGQGMTHGVIAGLLISDLIATGASPWSELYDPARMPIAAAKEFLSENLTAVKNFAEYVAPGELASADELAPGQGAIVRQGMMKVAAYRDDNGKLHLNSARCTHLGCHLHWNSLERCWDCPCHGSQFSPDGAVLQGPAISPLERVDS
jgi:glycine/D-amino acid oxidase-like deaminating enzyme/nitrite reductase/ring-hydroxylating ferredoxin subunit